MKILSKCVYAVALCVWLTASSFAQTSQQQNDDDGHHADLVRERYKYFMKGRTALGEESAELLQRGYEQKMRLRELRAAQARQAREAAAAAATPAGSQQAATGPIARVSPTFSSLTWQNLGPKPVNSANFGQVTGRITAIAVDQRDTTGNTVYVAGANGGVWKSTNAAQASPTWSPIFEQQPSLTIGSL